MGQEYPNELFSWEYLDNNDCNHHDICMSVMFSCNDEDDDDIIGATLLLDKTTNFGCTLKGHFEGFEDKMVAATSKDCPMNRDSSFWMTFWIPDLCPNHMFFSVHQNGIGVEYKQTSQNFTLQVDSKVAPLELPKNVVNIASNVESVGSNSLTDEYVIKLRIYYDDLFHNAFGTFATER